jgi:hypothetical protein
MPQRETVPIAPDDSRKQLGAFLRSRRESLDPQRLGLPRVGGGARRAAPGRGGDAGRCRRDLVHLAGTGREVNPSESVLMGVANALQCSPLETRHLFVLAGLTPPETTQVSVCEGSLRGPGGCSIA